LSAWKHNPTLPQGVIYEGVSDIRQQYYGGSAAQSSLLPFLDIGLGVSHKSTKSQDFLLSMREYMPRAHREFLGYMESVACVRDFVVESLKNRGIGPETRSDEPSPPTVTFSTKETPSSSLQDLIGTPQSPAAFYWAAQQQQQEQQQQLQQLQQQEQQQQQAASAASNATTLTAEAAARRAKENKVWLALRDAYDECIENLQTFRTCHISLVADYIMAQQKSGKPVSRASSTDNLQANAGGKGTGGTDLMKFLKPIRDNCGQSLLTAPMPRGAEEPSGGGGGMPDDEPYKKDNGRSEDIDLYRGAAYPTGRMLYTIPVDNGWNSVVGTTSGGSWSYSSQ
jgi:indoleamine 2,3-dioxygenase